MSFDVENTKTNNEMKSQVKNFCNHQNNNFKQVTLSVFVCWIISNVISICMLDHQMDSLTTDDEKKQRFSSVHLLCSCCHKKYYQEKKKKIIFTASVILPTCTPVLEISPKLTDIRNNSKITKVFEK